MSQIFRRSCQGQIVLTEQVEIPVTVRGSQPAQPEIFKLQILNTNMLTGKSLELAFPNMRFTAQNRTSEMKARIMK